MCKITHHRHQSNDLRKHSPDPQWRIHQLAFWRVGRWGWDERVLILRLDIDMWEALGLRSNYPIASYSRARIVSLIMEKTHS